jgi:hypothetical protein
MSMKGFAIGLLLFITMPVWVSIGIFVAGLLVIWQLGAFITEGE